MNYNLKVEMERINGNVVSNIEIASAGRATRKRIVSPDFDSAQADLKKVHAELLGQLETFHAPAFVSVNKEILEQLQHEKEKPVKAAKPKAKAKKKSPAKKAAKGKAKGK